MFKVSKRQSEKGRRPKRSGTTVHWEQDRKQCPVKKNNGIWVSLSGDVRNSEVSLHCKQSVRSEIVKAVPVPKPKGLIAARYNRSLNRFEIFWVLRCSSKAPCLPDERNKTENHIVKRKLLLQNCQAGFDCTMLRNTTRGTEPVSMSSTKRKYLHANQTVPAFTSSPESTPKTNFLRGSNKPQERLCGFMKKEIETYRNN